MPGRSTAIYKRALMRDLQRRIAKVSVECGDEVETKDGAVDGDEFTVLSKKMIAQVDAIKKDCRAKSRVADNSSMHEGVALSHEIRRKRAMLGDDIDKLKAMILDFDTDVEKKRAKAKNKRRKLDEVNMLEATQDRRKHTQAETLETVANLDMLINKVLQLATANEEEKFQNALNHKSKHRKLNLMGNTVKADGTFERPEAAQQEEMDEETQALFEAVEAKNQKIFEIVDRISKDMQRLKHLAKTQGDMLTTQGIMLTTVEEKMEHLEGELATLTVRIGKFSKQVRGSNFFLAICCCLILLALIGFIISMVIPDLIPH